MRLRQLECSNVSVNVKLQAEAATQNRGIRRLDAGEGVYVGAYELALRHLEAGACTGSH